MKISKKIIISGASIVALMASGALAQSTGSQSVETVIVKGSRNVGIVKKETGVKSKVVVDQALISKSAAGQTITETLNVVPGLNFTNNDAYGSSGGNIRIRGMDGSRISLTFDGAQLNDTGNYAIYTNQQLEPELICQASVNTGATDVDSMTASATGGTVNYTTCKPEDKLGGVVKLSAGSSEFNNAFVRFDTGKIGPWGTKAFVAYTGQEYDTWTRDLASAGQLEKTQYNFRIYQDLFDNGSFVSLSGHYNENRNRFMFSQTKAQIASRGYDWNNAGLVNINPSDTGNVRIQSKWVLTDKLTLTIDPTYQYVLANGGGSTSLRENDGTMCGSFFGTEGCGTDINKDGDKTDTVSVYNANTTNTNRLSVQSNLIYALTDTQTVRFNVSLDRGRHRQTGERALLNADGTTPDVFGGKENAALRIYSQDGKISQRRDRFSEANVDVFSLEYRGRFMDDKLTLSLGFRNQKLERVLNQNCYTRTNASANYLCTTQPEATRTATADADIFVVTFAGDSNRYVTPYKRTYEFKDNLLNLGATYKFDDLNQVFASFAQTMSSPKTDSIYNVTVNTTTNKMTPALPEPETSENYELGYRFLGSKLFATATAFYAKDKDRIVQAYDEIEQVSKDRNVGEVIRQGFETQVSFAPVKFFNVSAGYTYTEAEMQNDIAVGGSGATTKYLPTKGKTLAETPKHMATLGLNYDFDEVLHFGISGKYVGDRYSTDVNDDIAPAYDTWNANVRYDIGGVNSGTNIQFNVINLFDTKYLGSISSSNNAITITDSTGAVISSGSAPSFNVGAPRTFVVSLRKQF